MDSTDVVDEVNALLKLGVGDSYRLKHIKQAYIQNKNIWITDKNYLKRLREKYLEKQNPGIQSSADIVFENESEDKETIHCWKCGKKCPLGANFCMSCGTSLFEVGTTPPSVPEPKSSNSQRITPSIPLKIPVLAGIPILILIVLGTAYTMGYFDNDLGNSSSNSISDVVTENEEIFYGEYDPKCGSGTVLDPETNACRLGSVKTSSVSETDSKCGPGTIFDSESNSCIVG